MDNTTAFNERLNNLNTLLKEYINQADLADVLPTTHGQNLITVKNVHQILNTNLEKKLDDPQAIKRALFLSIVKENLDTLVNSMAQLDMIKKYSVSLEVFNEKLSNLECSTPFGMEFRAFLQEEFKQYLSPTIKNVYNTYGKVIRYYNNEKILKAHYNEYCVLSYKTAKIIHIDLMRDLNAINQLLLACTDVPIINDPVFVETTPKYKENLANRVSIEKTLLKLKEDTDSKTNARYEKLNFTNTTNLNCKEVKRNLEKKLKTDDEEIKLLYSRILKQFDFQIEMPCYDALDAITNIISAFEKDENYTQLYVDRKNLSPNFITGNTFAKALADAKSGAGGDATADSLFQVHFNNWQKDCIDQLKLIDGDTQSIADLDFVQGYVKKLSHQSLSIFRDFWTEIEDMVNPDHIEIDIASLKSTIKEHVKELKSTNFDSNILNKSQLLTISLPDIAAVATAINDSRLDTSFQYYLEQWSLWSQSNLKVDLGISNGKEFYELDLRENLKRLFAYEQAGTFFCDDIDEVIKLLYNTVGDTENALLIGKYVNESWAKLLDRAAPNQSDFEDLKQSKNGKELYNHIVTYTKYLPTFADIQIAIKEAQKSERKALGVKYRGTLIGDFVKYNWLDYGMIPKSRGFKCDVKAYLKETKGGFFYVSSISAKTAQQWGIKLGAKKVKFNLQKPSITNDTCMQIINVEIDVQDFGSENSSTSLGGGAISVQGSTSYGDSAPIGSGIYKTTLVFKYTKNGDALTVDFDVNNTTLTNLPTLEFDMDRSSLLQPISK